MEKISPEPPAATPEILQETAILKNWVELVEGIS